MVGVKFHKDRFFLQKILILDWYLRVYREGKLHALDEGKIGWYKSVCTM
jgi:hypothetical protein